jgi:hypothetical protein
MMLPWLAMDLWAGRFFTKPSVRTAILVYIIIVAVSYHYLLAKLWNPQGWQLVANAIEHIVALALYVIDWGPVQCQRERCNTNRPLPGSSFPSLSPSIPDPRHIDRLLSLSLHR